MHHASCTLDGVTGKLGKTKNCPLRISIHKVGKKRNQNKYQPSPIPTATKRYEISKKKGK
jgi:hypothetical protein